MTEEKTLLSEQLERRGCSAHAWSYLRRSMFPDIDIETLLTYLDYCAERGLEVLKKPAEIVKYKESYKDEHGQWKKRDKVTIITGIHEARITAHRTGQYLGQEDHELGENMKYLGLDAPEYAKVTVIRATVVDGKAIQGRFPGIAYFRESCTTVYDSSSGEKRPNAIWKQRPIYMLIKAAETHALRRAFPEQVGNLPMPDELADSEIEIEAPIEAETRTILDVKTEERGQIEHQKGNDLDELLAVTRPDLQPASVAAREGLEKVVNDKGIPGDKPMDGKTIDQEAKIEPEPKKKAKGKKKPPPTKEPDNKIPVDDPPSPEELVNVPSFAPLSTGPAKDEPPPYGELDLGGGK